MGGRWGEEEGVETKKGSESRGGGGDLGEGDGVEVGVGKGGETEERCGRVQQPRDL